MKGEDGYTNKKESRKCEMAKKGERKSRAPRV
jgi:hypothetical protein